MPGSSLWLVPDPSHPLHALITKLIEVTLPAHFAQATPAPPKFAPHLTLTSNIDPSIYASDPQGWLDAIPFPGASEVNVEFERVKTEDVFFRRCYIKCGFEGVQRVAGLARARGVLGEEDIGEKTASWLAEWRASFGPHVSLLYGNDPIDEDSLEKIERAVQQEGISLTKSPLAGGLDGWKGGVVWLVPTDRDIAEWKPVATRTL